MFKFSAIIKSSLLAIALTLSSCASRSSVPQPPINIPENYMHNMADELDSTGFQLGMINRAEIKKYNKAILNVKMSDPLVEPGFFDGIKTGYLFYSDEDVVNEILPYAKDSFQSALLDSKYFSGAYEPDPATLNINVYITQIVINDAFWGTLGNIPSPTWIISKPISMMIMYLSNKGGGAVAVEIMVTDSETGKAVAIFQDREKGIFALFNIEGFSMFDSQKRILDTWSEDLISTLDQAKAGTAALTANKIAPTLQIIYY